MNDNERRILTALAGHDWATPNTLQADLADRAYSKQYVGRVMTRMHKAGWVSMISGPRKYRATATGLRVLEALIQREARQPADDAWAGHRFGTPAGEITVPCQMVELAEGERVCTIYDLPGTTPILAIGVTTEGSLLFGIRAGKDWKFEPQWIGRCGMRPSALQDTLEQVAAEQHVIDRQRYPSVLRLALRDFLLEGPRTLAEIEAAYPAMERRTLIGELARMRDDGFVIFEGPRYRLNPGKPLAD